MAFENHHYILLNRLWQECAVWECLEIWKVIIYLKEKDVYTPSQICITCEMWSHFLVSLSGFLKLAFSYVFILSVFVCVHARLCVCVCVSCSVVPDSLTPHGLWPARLLCPWDSPGRNTGVGCHSLPQGIFLTQRWNLCLLYCRQIFTIWATRETFWCE